MRRYRVRFGTVAAEDFADYILVFNPAYSKKVVHICPGRSACLSQLKLNLNRWRGERDRSLLRSMTASIDQEGLFNPLFAIGLKEGLFVACGTRRIICCKWLTLNEIPVVIADYTGRFDDLEELNTRDEIFAKFRDPPEYFCMDDNWMFMDKLADSEAYTLR